MAKRFGTRIWAHRYLTVLVLILGMALRSAAGVPDPVLQPGAFLCFVADAILFEDEEACDDALDALEDWGLLSVNQPGDAPALFEPNLGQTDAGFDFRISGGSADFLLNGDGPTIRSRKGAIRAVYTGASHAQAEPLDLQPGRVNYLIGNRPDRWVTNVPTYARVRYRNVYPGIDVIYYGKNSQLEHDFVVAPGADPTRIRVEFSGAESIEVDSTGALQLHGPAGTLAWHKPVIYQEVSEGVRRKIEGRYRVDGGKAIAFEVGVFDPKKPLVIDPVLAFSTYYGRGNGETAVRSVADANGNVYYTGVSGDSSYPQTGGALSGGIFSGPLDVIITKLSADGKTPVYTTHFGGTDAEIGSGIALDSSGNIYVTGMTLSPDFPVTKNVQSPAPSVGDHAGKCFVSKLNPAGSALVYSTLLGGGSSDACTSIAVDSTGAAIVAGAAFSRDFPTRNAAQGASHIGTSVTSITDAFISKLSPDGASLQYSTFVGGSNNDGIAALAVDAAGNAYATGATISSDFPVTAGVLQSRYGGNNGGNSLSPKSTGDAFVVKLSPAGAVLYSTYLGGAGDEVGFGIAVDAQGDAYVAGSTLSRAFPTKNAFQAANAGSGGETRLPGGDAFVAKLNPQATDLIYSTYLGGSLDDRATAIAVDSQGNAYITGNTLSENFPVSSDAFQPANAGQRSDGLLPVTLRTGDAFFAQLGPAGARVYATYLGGSGADFGTGIAVDRQGGAILVGGTNSTNFPVTPGAAQTLFGGASGAWRPIGDAFVTRFGNLTDAPPVSVTSVENAASYASNAVAPGEIVIVKGIGIGPSSVTTAQLDSTGGIAKTLAGTRVLFDDVAAPLIYVSANQSSAVVPYGVSGRANTSVVVEYNGIRSPATTVPVTAVVPGLFSADSSGRGQGAILNQDGTYNSPANPAARGSVIQIFGTGEGLTTPAGVDGRINGFPAPTPVGSVSVLFGGRIARMTYAGGVSGVTSGLFQVNAVVPDDAAPGNVVVQVQVGTALSQSGFTVFVK